jgi:TfoX/Sxy family transcriptional regulator of competence genes
MSYNTTLEDRIEDLVRGWDGLERKKMFGGVCYLVNGNMAFGIWKDFLIVRMAPSLAEEKRHQPHVGEFDLTGKPMKGWVMVEKGSWDDTVALDGWLRIGKAFALTLPVKKRKGASLEEIYYRTHR